MASIFAAALFASPSTSAGLWSNIKSFFRSFFGSFYSSSSNTDTDENSTSNEDNNVTDPQENEKLNTLIEQLVKQNDVPIFITVNGRKKDSPKTLKKLSYDHYNSIISNKELSSKLKIKMANKSDFKHGNDVFLILSKAEDKDISDHIKNWEAKKKDYRDRHENIMKN